MFNIPANLTFAHAMKSEPESTVERHQRTCLLHATSVFAVLFILLADYPVQKTVRSPEIHAQVEGLGICCFQDLDAESRRLRQPGIRCGKKGMYRMQYSSAMRIRRVVRGECFLSRRSLYFARFRCCSSTAPRALYCHRRKAPRPLALRHAQ